jgi:hypothetical protein
MRKFDTGATRDDEDTKPDYEGFLSPLVLQGFGRYMHKHRTQGDGDLRGSDNWQKGMPLDCYIKSAWRHFLDWWLEHRGGTSRAGLEDALYGLMFNVMGYLHVTLKEKGEVEPEKGMGYAFTYQPKPPPEKPYQAIGYEMGLDPNSGEPLALRFGGITKAEYEYRNPHNNSHAARVLEGKV